MRFRKKRTYLDYASATPVLPEALRAMRRAESCFGNPGAIHSEGAKAAALLQESREKIARELGVKARELVFTSGGTESNNLAILGFARHIDLVGRYGLEGTHWVTSAIEHPSVLECFAEIERKGGEVTCVDPDSRGVISPEVVERALRENTIFLSIQWANHEIGVVQPLRAMSRKIRAFEDAHVRQIVFHSDLGQAPLYLSPQIHTLGIDLASVDSGKLYGPRSIGALYVRNRVTLAPIILGGGQERGLRAGTERVVSAAGFAEAFLAINRERAREARRLATLRDDLAREIVARIPGAVVNGATLTAGRNVTHSLPHMLSISVPNMPSEYVTLALDRAGIAISTKSACREGEARRSHVVAALFPEDTDAWRSENTLRFSLGRDTRAGDCARAVFELTRILNITV